MDQQRARDIIDEVIEYEKGLEVLAKKEKADSMKSRKAEKKVGHIADPENIRGKRQELTRARKILEGIAYLLPTGG